MARRTLPMQTSAHLETRDTIVALATVPGPGGRAIVRLSGPDAQAIAISVFAANGQHGPIGASDQPAHAGCSPRHFREGAVHLPNVSPLPADLYIWSGPRSYTGQDMAELHQLSCLPLVELLIAELLRAGARAA